MKTLFKFELYLNDVYLDGTIDYSYSSSSHSTNDPRFIDELKIYWDSLQFNYAKWSDIDYDDEIGAKIFCHGFVKGYGIAKIRAEIEKQINEDISK